MRRGLVIDQDKEDGLRFTRRLNHKMHQSGLDILVKKGKKRRLIGLPCKSVGKRCTRSEGQRKDRKKKKSGKNSGVDERGGVDGGEEADVESFILTEEKNEWPDRKCFEERDALEIATGWIEKSIKYSSQREQTF